MPEGDSIFRAARALHRALAGSSVTRFESMIPALNRVNEDHPIAGRQVRGVAARGKHILMEFSGDLVLHPHMRMNGSWHLYKPGERWRRPRRDMRVVVETETRVAVGFNIPVAEFLIERDLSRHRALQALGPDLLDSGFDPVEVHRRLALRSADTVANVLLDQRVMAGVGNELPYPRLAGVAGGQRARDAVQHSVQRRAELSDLGAGAGRIDLDDRRGQPHLAAVEFEVGHLAGRFGNP